jgi:hypothetical protein
LPRDAIAIRSEGHQLAKRKSRFVGDILIGDMPQASGLTPRGWPDTPNGNRRSSNRSAIRSSRRECE